MVNSTIENFVESARRKNRVVRIQFKNREAIDGTFIISTDYEEMKKKNFWRIVTTAKAIEWRNTKNLSCSRLFNGNEFTKLSDL